MMAMGAFFLSLFTAVLGMVRLPKPGVLPESASRFKVGFPDDFAPDSRRKIEGRPVWLFRDSLGFFAISAICTHLGCLVSENPKTEGFDCPCHGSKFDSKGAAVSGPAPRGLDWLEMSLAADGNLMVDSAKTVTSETRFRA